MDVWDKSPLPPPDRAFDGGDRGDGGGSGSGDGGGSGPPDRPGGSPPPQGSDPWWARRVAAVPVWIWGLLFVAVFAVLTVVASTGGSDDDSPGEDAAPTLPTVPDVAELSPPPADSGASPTVAPPPAADSTTTVAPTTTVAVTTTAAPSTTVAPTTTAAPSTTAAPTTTVTATTAAPPTTAADPSTTAPTVLGASTVTGSDGESLTVTPRREACRFGPDCLVVAFTIDGFDIQPERFVCEFASGNRFEFRFETTSVDPACSTTDNPGSIIVEVGELRSDPVTIDAG